MRSPAPLIITPTQLGALSARIGLDHAELRLIEPSGIINSVYTLDEECILRVPRNHPAHIEQLRREVLAIPAAVAAGVSTADILLFDDSGDVLPLPYLVIKRLRGRNMETLRSEPRHVPEVWRSLGRDLGRLHTARVPLALLAFQRDEYDALFAADPRELAECRAADGWFTALEAGWLVRWLERLAPYASTETTMCLVHADVQMSNILLHEATDTYKAIIDWGCARRSEPSMDFLSMPLAAVPILLEGHREIAPLPNDEAAEGRILWRRLQCLLSVLPRGSARDCSWGERPVAWLVDLMRFFLDAPGERWREIAPPS